MNTKSLRIIIDVTDRSLFLQCDSNAIPELKAGVRIKMKTLNAGFHIGAIALVAQSSRKQHDADGWVRMSIYHKELNTLCNYPLIRNRPRIGDPYSTLSSMWQLVGRGLDLDNRDKKKKKVQVFIGGIQVEHIPENLHDVISALVQAQGGNTHEKLEMRIGLISIGYTAQSEVRGLKTFLDEMKTLYKPSAIHRTKNEAQVQPRALSKRPIWIRRYLDYSRDVQRFQDTRYYVDGKVETWKPPSNHVPDPQKVQVFKDSSALEHQSVNLMRVSSVLAGGPRIAVLLGDPGAGKTTSLRRFLHVKAQEIKPSQPDERLPLYVDLTNRADDPEKLMCAAIKEATGIEPHSSEWARRKFTIMFDGVDRMKLDCDFQHFFRRIRDHQVWAPHSRVILTCKMGEWNPAYLSGDDVDTYKICPFGVEERDEIAEYVELRLGVSRSVPRQIVRDWRLFEMARNPQLLAMMCDLLDPTRPDEGLPSQKAHLIKEWIKHKLAIQGVGKDWFADAGEAFLLKAASLMMERGVLEISRNELEKANCHIPPYRVGTRNVIELAVDAGILASSGHTARSGCIRFIHQTFQEYFTARSLATQSDDWRLVAISHVYDQKWTEVLILLGNMLSDRCRVYIAALLRETAHDFLMRPLHLAVNIAATSTNDDLPTCVIDRLRRTTVEFGVREDLIPDTDHLVTRWGETALELLLPLSNPIAMRVVYLLGEIRGERAFEHVLPLLKDSNERVRGSAAIALARIAGEKAIKHLLPLLKDKEPEIRWRAIEGLGEIKGKRAFEYALPLLKDLDVRVRGSAAIALARIDKDKALEHVLPLLKDDDARMWAEWALGDIGGEKAIKYLLPLLKDKKPEIRAVAVDVIGWTANERYFEHILPLLNDKEEWVRQAAVTALSKIGGKRALEHVLPFLKDRDERVRLATTIALARIDAKKGLALVLPLLNDNELLDDCSLVIWPMTTIALQQSVAVPIAALPNMLQDRVRGFFAELKQLAAFCEA
jgi:HEAT repeat protein